MLHGCVSTRLNPPAATASLDQTGLGRVGQSRFTLGQATSMGRRDRPTFLSEFTSLRPGDRLRGANPCPAQIQVRIPKSAPQSAAATDSAAQRLLLVREPHCSARNESPKPNSVSAKHSD